MYWRKILVYLTRFSTFLITREFLLLFIVILAAGLSITILMREVGPQLYQAVVKLGSSAGLIAVFVLTAFSALRYLQPGRSRRFDLTGIEDFGQASKFVAAHVAMQLADHSKLSIKLTDEERQVAIDKIASQLQTEMVANEVRKLEAAVAEATSQKAYREPMEQARKRLMQQSEASVRRGNLNLVIGMMMAVTGVTILGQTFFYRIGPLGWDGVLVQYAPRLSLVFLIEVFAYFFLRLYKQSLSDGKYYQNELTNIELKLSSLNAAFDLGAGALLDKVIENLVATERNFVLEKGQSTVELQLSKLQHDAASSQLRELVVLLRGGVPNRSGA